MNVSHSSRSSVKAEKHDEVISSLPVESEVGRAPTNETGDKNARHTVTADRGGSEVTLNC